MYDEKIFMSNISVKKLFNTFGGDINPAKVLSTFFTNNRLVSREMHSSHSRYSYFLLDLMRNT